MGAKRQAKRRGFPQNLYQHPNGYFYYRNPQNGKVKGIGHDKSEAFREARAANAVLATLTKSSLASWVSGVEEYTLDQWLDKYMDIWQKHKKPAPETLATAQRYMKRIKLADFAWMNVRDVTTQHVSEYLNKLERSSTASVAKNLRARLHDVFAYAQNYGLTETGKNPVSATLVPEYEVKRERLSLEQFSAIRAKVPAWAAHGMMLALLTGQRISDVVNMRFADYRDGALFIIQGKTGFKLQQDGKIRLQAVGMSIEEAVRACRTRVISPYMVHHTRTSGKYKAGEQVSADGLSAVFSAARDACGIVSADGRTPPTFHEIRSLAERLYKKEYGAEFSQSIMGHKHAKMTAEYDDTRGGDWKVIQAK